MKTKELKTELKNFTQIWDHIEELLTVRNIQERTRIETLMIFEALYNDMLAKGIPEDTVVKVWKIRVFGEVRIKIDFEGSLYVPISAEGDDFGAGSGTGTDDMVCFQVDVGCPHEHRAAGVCVVAQEVDGGLVGVDDTAVLQVGVEVQLAGVGGDRDGARGAAEVEGDVFGARSANGDGASVRGHDDIAVWGEPVVSAGGFQFDGDVPVRAGMAERESVGESGVGAKTDVLLPLDDEIGAKNAVDFAIDPVGGVVEIVGSGRRPQPAGGGVCERGAAEESKGEKIGECRFHRGVIFRWEASIRRRRA